MTHPHPMADQALERLRALAEGNGLAAEAVTLAGAREKIYTLEGTLTLHPLCETRAEHYLGKVRGGKDRQIMPSLTALTAEVQKRQQEFKSNPDWIPEAIKELHDQPGEGWGLDNAKITLPDHSAIFVAAAPCPSCHGQKVSGCASCQGRGFTVCLQCKGQRQEFCYTCNGVGANPQKPGERCTMCNGLRYIPCRLCRSTGQTPCPACKGKGGAPCRACKGAGQATEEVHLTCGATTHFKMQGEDLPAGLRRGLDRLGIVNLAKGHADIEIVEKVEEPEESAPFQPPQSGSAPDEPEEKPPQPVVHYQAKLPFAEMRVNFGKQKALIGVFGKRGVLLDVPYFLDEAIKLWRVILKEAAKGRASIDEAIKARVIKDALALDLQGKSKVKELRRLYPFGLSAAAAEDILRDIKKAIKRYTLRVRTFVAIGCGLLSAGFFTACLFTSMPQRLAYGPRWIEYVFDFAPPLLAMVLDWIILDLATYYTLHRHFPDLKIALRQRTGKTGYTMEAGILIVWFTALALSPAAPTWLSWLRPVMHSFNGIPVD